jgi:hypothetical protein
MKWAPVHRCGWHHCGNIFGLYCDLLMCDVNAIVVIWIMRFAYSYVIVLSLQILYHIGLCGISYCAIWNISGKCI